ncbi:MAG: PAS domain S-box protein, partial [Acidobacteria bacterium]|nr:PAS domain S-box protein [Acidobacteriota bacterium]
AAPSAVPAILPLVAQEQPRITVNFQEADIRDVLGSFAEFTGRSIVPGSDVSGAVTATIRDQPWDVALQTILREGHVQSTGRVKRPDGTEIDVEYSASVARLGDEQLILAILRDITERKKAEASRALLATIVETSEDAIFAATPDAVLVSWNRGAEAIYGYSAEEIVGESAAILVPEDRMDEFRMLVRKLKQGETTRHFRTRRRRKDGQLIDLSLTISPITNESGEVVGASVMARDITMEKALEEQKRLSGLGRVAATIAHEMNNVLMGIQPFNEVLRMKWGHEPGIESISERISNALRRGKHITGEILRFTKPSQPNRQPLDLVEWVHKHEPEYREAIGSAIDFEIVTRLRSSVTISKSIGSAIDFEIVTEERSLVVAADQYQLQQVITNLVLNARDATPPGGRIELRVGAGDGAGSALDGRKGERFAAIVVSDTGVGMPKEVADRIFEPLFTTKQNGTGIGLAVAHQIVTSHDGIISLDTEPGRGTRFVVTLPLAEDRAAS